MSFLSSLMNALPGAIAQGLAWGIMAIGVYITFRILDVADLTVDSSLATGGAVCVMLIRAGVNPWLAMLCALVSGMLAGLVTGLFHTRCGIPAILAGILTQLALYSINLRIMGGKANQAVSVDKYHLLLSQRYVRTLSLDNPLPLLIVLTAVIVAALYWFFGTEKGSSLRATGANPHMTRAQGINTSANIVLGLMLSNGLVALSGALLAQYQGSSDINMGRGAIVIGLAAVIIGEVMFGKLSRSVGVKLLNATAGTLSVDSGEVYLDGVDVTDLPEYKRAAYIGRVFQDPMMGTAPSMHIEENLALAARRGQKRGLRWGITKAERETYRTMLRDLGLGLETRLSSEVSTLSGGQRQALTLLMATLKSPKLLLLDEHTAALDPKTAAKVMELTDRIVTKEQLTTLMITHNMRDAIQYGSRLVMLHEGRVILDISGEEKKNLTVTDLLAQFAKVSGDEFSSDRALLS